MCKIDTIMRIYTRNSYKVKYFLITFGYNPKHYKPRKNIDLQWLRRATQRKITTKHNIKQHAKTQKCKKT